MIRELVTYENYNGEEVTEELFFNLTKTELLEFELASGGGLSERLKTLSETQDGRKIVQEFKNIIISSYGEKSDDGKRFIKDRDARNAFLTSEAYSTFFMNLFTTPGKAVEFIQGVIPSELVDEILAEIGSDDEDKDVENEESGTDEPVVEDTPEVINRSEYNTMSPLDKAEVAKKVSSGKAVFNEDLSN